MKILYSYNLIDNDNEYVSKMVGLTKKVPDVQVFSSLEEFWNPTQRYDYIFINWPDYLLGWKKNISDEEIEILENKVLEFKKNNTKIIHIRHDTYPHSDKSKNAKRLYDIFNEKSDIIVHLGNYSVKEFKTKYTDYTEQKHFVMPHILFETFDFNLNRRNLRSQYGLKANDYFIFVPGNMRNYDEFKVALKLYDKINKKNKLLHFQKVQKSFFPSKKFSIRYLVHYFKTIFLYRPKRITYGFTYLNPNQISEFFTISDLVLIPRIDNLNSGNTTLSAQFNKKYIAIESGNITEWTKYLDQIVIQYKDVYNRNKINICDRETNLIDRISKSSHDQIIINILKKILV